MFIRNSKLTPLWFALALFFFGGVGGTCGYHLIEGYSWLDAFYMTVITTSTVGFGEIKQLSDAGKVFTSLFILFNLATFTFLISVFSRFVFEGEFKKMLRNHKNMARMKKMQNHVIVCGYGRYGKRAVEELKENGEDFIIIESDEHVLEQAGLSEEEKQNVLVGDASADEVLKEAGIEKAKALIAGLPQDASNVFVTLSARDLNADLQIIARASLDSTKKKLLTAGANHVILPDVIGGHFMASLVTRPQVMGFLERIAGWSDEKIILEEIRYEDLYEEFKDKTIGEIGIHSKYDVTVVGYKDKGEHYSFNPKAKLKIQEGGVIIILGDPSNITGFKENCTHD